MDWGERQYQEVFEPPPPPTDTATRLMAEFVGPEYFPRKRRAVEVFEYYEPPVIPVVIPTFFGSVYPDKFERKARVRDFLEYYEPPVPIIPAFFRAVYPDEVRRRARGVLDTNSWEQFQPPAPAPNLPYDPEIPDFLLRSAEARRFYLYAPSTFPSLRIVIPSVGDFHDLIMITSLTARIDVRREVDSGVANCLASDVGGTPVTFNKFFKDVDGITTTADDVVQKTAIFDFLDVPNPVGFKILVYDAAGARVNALVRWLARGVV